MIITERASTSTSSVDMQSRDDDTLHFTAEFIVGKIRADNSYHYY